MRKISMIIILCLFLGFLFSFTFSNLENQKAIQSTAHEVHLTCPEGTELKDANIPQVVQNFITSNITKSKIEEVVLLDNHGTANYGIELKRGKLYLLGADGKLIYEGKESRSRLSIKKLPAKIPTYVTANYPNTKIDEADIEKKYGNTYIEVELENDTELIFDKAGNFLCADSEDDDDDDEDDDDDDDNH